MTPEGVRDGFWVDAHIRRNHGVADVWGMRESRKLASTAGAWAITPGAAYLACVETRPEARGKGYASALVRGLVARHAGKTCSLMCGAALIGFYAKLGFTPAPCRGYVWGNPEPV
jgi:GNAT superfamily N-acetyltransferase